MREVDPMGIFIMETKIKDDRLSLIFRRLGFVHFISVPPVGCKGGIAFRVLCSLVHGPAYWKDKGEFWEDLGSVGTSNTLPRVSIGDFNEVLLSLEKQGGRLLPGSSSCGLRHFMDSMGFVDLGFSGRKFTWNNGRIGLANIRERLDRSIANVQWRVNFPNAGVRHYAVTTSDHIPLILNFFWDEARVAKCFKFEQFWARKETCFGVIADAWRQPRNGTSAWVLFSKIRTVRDALRQWNRSVFGDIHVALQAVKAQLSHCQQGEPTSQNLWMEHCLILEMDEQLRREELLWKQKSRVPWLSSSDLNTKYFHASTVICRCRNKILELKGNNGDWISGHQSIGVELVSFYSSLYTTDQPNVPSDLEGLVDEVISEEENCMLIRLPDEKEIWEILKGMDPNKAPGSDGMTVFFFRQYWAIVGRDGIAAVQEFFSSGWLLPQLNHTNLVLIPKVDNPSLVGQFRPISLCNVIYKIISKILTERIKVVLPKLISPYQLAFVKGRLLQDNYIVAAEVFNGMNHKRG